MDRPQSSKNFREANPSSPTTFSTYRKMSRLWRWSVRSNSSIDELCMEWIREMKTSKVLKAGMTCLQIEGSGCYRRRTTRWGCFCLVVWACKNKCKTFYEGCVISANSASKCVLFFTMATVLHSVRVRLNEMLSSFAENVDEKCGETDRD